MTDFTRIARAFGAYEQKSKNDYNYNDSIIDKISSAYKMNYDEVLIVPIEIINMGIGEIEELQTRINQTVEYIEEQIYPDSDLGMIIDVTDILSILKGEN